MRTPSRASISARRRGIVQLRGSAAASLSKGVATREAASLLTGDGLGAMLAFSRDAAGGEIAAPEPNLSSRTQNASAISGLVQPASVSSTARPPVRLPTIARTGQSRKGGVVHRSPQPETSLP
jgi:hypothetical protein